MAGDEYLEKGIAAILSRCAPDSVDAERLVSVMKKYCAELELFNSAYDLVGADTHDDVVIRHVLDSLAAVPVMQKLIAERMAANHNPVIIADAGSGGGLPGIPLAAAFPHVQFELLERMAKRCTFLESCALMTGLTNVTVINKEIEKCPRGRYDIVTFRAFRPLDMSMTQSILALRKADGVIAAYKAKKVKIQEEMAAISSLVPSWRLESLSVPFLDNTERHIVVF